MFDGVYLISKFLFRFERRMHLKPLDISKLTFTTVVLKILVDPSRVHDLRRTV